MNISKLINKLSAFLFIYIIPIIFDSSLFFDRPQNKKLNYCIIGSLSDEESLVRQVRKKHQA